LLLHNMGPGLADGISQGDARGDEFRTAPLWGLGQRIFFLHDGRTRDLRAAIQAHASPGDLRTPPSEANLVIAQFNQLPEFYKQSILNFLRGLQAAAVGAQQDPVRQHNLTGSCVVPAIATGRALRSWRRRAW